MEYESTIREVSYGTKFLEIHAVLPTRSYLKSKGQNI